MGKIVIITLSLMILSCTTTATRSLYKPLDKSGGYVAEKIKDDVYAVSFFGNARTHANDAHVFTLFRAIEICFENGFKVTRIHEVEEKSTSQTVQKSSSYTYQQPTYFSGTANTNANHNYVGGNTLYSNANTSLSGAAYGGSAFGGSKTWNETYYYPAFQAQFSCYNNIQAIGAKLRQLSADDVAEFVKDRLGAVQIIKVLEESSNQDTLQLGDIIIKLNNTRIVDVPQLVGKISSTREEGEATARIIREGKSMDVNLKVINYTEEASSMNEEIIDLACKAQEVASRPICSRRSISSEN